MRTLLPALGALAIGCCLISGARGEPGVRWQTNLDTAKKMAADSNRLVLIHFTASWCRWCKPLEQNVFNQDAVAQAIEAHYVPVKLDFDQDRALAKQYGINGPPWDVVIMPDGQVVRDFNSPQKPDQYITRVTEIAQRVRPQTNTMLAANGAGAVPAGYAGAPPANAVAQQAPRAGWTDDRYGDYRNQRQPPVADSANPPLANQVTPPVQANYNLPGAFGPGTTGAVVPPTGAALPGNNVTPPVGNAAPPSGNFAPPAQNFDPRFQNQPGIAQGPGSTGIQPPAPAANGGIGGPAPASGPAPSFGLDGYCPVHLAEKASWTPGDRRFGAVHRGKTYLFASEGCQKKFMADPDRYSPAFGGNDPVILTERNQTVPGRREIGCYFGLEPNRRIVLFADEASYQAFSRNPQRYAAGIFGPQP